MKLLDVMPTENITGHMPSEGSCRDCALDVVIREICADAADPELGSVITGALGAGETYRFYPVTVEASLPCTSVCWADDDEAWLADALKDATESALGLALTVEPGTGATNWFGHTDVASVTGLEAARASWVGSHVGRPVLHLPPSQVPAQLTARHIRFNRNDDDLYTVWGDPVVVNDSYTGTYWTSKFPIYLGPPTAESVYDRRNNRATVIAERVAVAALSPHMVVAVGS